MFFIRRLSNGLKCINIFLINNADKFKGSKHFKMFTAFSQATLLESSLDPAASITTPSLVDIIVFSLLIEPDSELICFSKRMSK